MVRNCILLGGKGNIMGLSVHLILVKFREVGAGIDPGIFRFHHDHGVEVKTERQ